MRLLKDILVLMVSQKHTKNKFLYLTFFFFFFFEDNQMCVYTQTDVLVATFKFFFF